MKCVWCTDRQTLGNCRELMVFVQPDLVLPRGQVIKRGTMVVGDDEAIITLK